MVRPAVKRKVKCHVCLNSWVFFLFYSILYFIANKIIGKDKKSDCQMFSSLLCHHQGKNSFVFFLFRSILYIVANKNIRKYNKAIVRCFRSCFVIIKGKIVKHNETLLEYLQSCFTVPFQLLLPG